MAEPLLIAKNAQTSCSVLPALANRHGLITGATGTGKTVTLQTLAENFSNIGVPVFMADVKGDLTGISQLGHIGEKLATSKGVHMVHKPLVSYASTPFTTLPCTSVRRKSRPWNL